MNELFRGDLDSSEEDEDYIPDKSNLKLFKINF
jgi:hypothetical protein